MKNWNFAKWSLSVGFALAPLLAGCQQQTGSSPVIVAADAEQTVSTDASASNAPTPGVAEQNLENAPGKVISTPQPSAQGANLSAPASEIARLAQSGVDESVMLAYVNNSTSTFNLGSDQIIYLNDIGVPGSVVTAMMQHDQKFAASTPPPTVSNPPPQPQQEPQDSGAIEAPLTPPPQDVAAAPQENVTYSYFYNSLAPYGNWVDIEGYGPCWQPSVVVANAGWSPYCDHGRWIYSDCGWYWASDYSWGWAPFHYGRWFHHRTWGWCWAPDTVWGPAWVSWRYSPGYCGWAPLPPTACWTPGFGFTYFGRGVGVDFSFGIGANFFTFVRAGDFCDPHPWRHRIPRHDVTTIINNTTIINPVIEGHGSRFHKGIPVDRISAVTHQEIKPVRIHETTEVPRGNHGEHFDRTAGTLTVFHPRLPDPPARGPARMVGEGIKPATIEHTARPENGMSKGVPRQTFAPANQAATERRNQREPIYQAPGVSSVRPPSENNARNNNFNNLQTAPNNFNNPRPTPPARNQAPLNSLNTTRRNFEPTPQPRIETPTPSPNVTAPRTPPQRNDFLNRRDQPMNIAPTQPSAPRWNQFNQESPPIQRYDSPRNQQRDERVLPRTEMPIQRQPDVRTYQAPPMPAREPRGSFSPAPQMPSAPAAPSYSRPEVRQAPAAQGNQQQGQQQGGSPRSGRDH